MMKLTSALIASLLTLAAPAFAQGHSGHGGAAGMSADPAYAAQMQAHEAMTKDMGAVKPSGNPDVDFVRMMIPHHQGAIDMAEVELKYGKDESRKKLARDIIHAQTQEIAEMKDWLAKNRK
jgi:uncharacterized protein (DUF305 family)